MYENEWENLLSKKKRDVILKRAKDYYEKEKERLREQARDKYRNLSEEGKKWENTEETNIIICLKKKIKN